jgi:hypothetical protein
LAPSRFWTLDDDDTFRYAAVQSVSKPQVGYAGDGYLFFGRTGEGWAGAVSVDGITWIDSPTPLGACGVRDIIKGPSQVLVVSFDAAYGACDHMWLVDIIPS